MNGSAAPSPPASSSPDILPEGGNIDGEHIDDLVSCLHQAIEFGRNAGRVTRDDAARKLWAIVYPKQLRKAVAN